MTWNRLDAELLDVLQKAAMKRNLPLTVRTAETEHSYPLPTSRAMPVLSCPYCGRKRCAEHRDLPSLDPYFEA